MDNVHCTGTESTLTSCRYTTDHNCEHSEDAGVRCTRKCEIYVEHCEAPCNHAIMTCNDS